MRVSSSSRLRPPYSSGSRRPSTSRFAPFRTSIRTAATLDGAFDQRVERSPNVVVGQLDAGDGASRRLEEHESRASARGLLVAPERCPGPLALGADRPGLEHTFDF